MADALNLTDGPVTVSGATKQELRLAVDVSSYDEVQCNLAANLGLYAAGIGAGRIDLGLTGVSFFRGSMCRSGREAACPGDSKRAGGICMECNMTTPVDEASKDAWESTRPWTRPDGCE